MNYDIAVIGAGSGGLSVAAAAAQFGQRVVLFEKGKMGGDCLNYGCVPSKALIAAAKHAHAIRKAKDYGIATNGAKVDFAKVNDYVHEVIDSIAPVDSQERFEGLGVKVVGRLRGLEHLRKVFQLLLAHAFLHLAGEAGARFLAVSVTVDFAEQLEPDAVFFDRFFRLHAARTEQQRAAR
ncbi:MAG: FAD-dependent oxidoreductase [Rhizobiales bacterium]|nr:FAD-dependent oxidoreductase [Hyphomicrobiales bacterium]